MISSKDYVLAQCTPVKSLKWMKRHVSDAFNLLFMNATELIGGTNKTLKGKKKPIIILYTLSALYHSAEEDLLFDILKGFLWTVCRAFQL